MNKALFKPLKKGISKEEMHWVSWSAPSIYFCIVHSFDFQVFCLHKDFNVYFFFYIVNKMYLYFYYWCCCLPKSHSQGDILSIH